MALLSLAGCAADAPPPPAAAPAPPLYAAPPTYAVPPPAASVYTSDEAVHDALSGPLELVGIGQWTGYFRHLSCIYRNAQVVVVDMRCNKRETYQFRVIVLSPSRGRVEIVADARQKTAALSTVQRAGYETFEISGAAPWAGPPAMSLSMSYDEIAAHDEQRQFQGGCELTTRMPQAVCSHGAAYTPPAFASANARFFEAPPVSAKQLAAWAGAVGFQHDIDVAEEMLPFVGQRDHLAAAVPTDDGGMAYAGTRRGAQAVLAKLDRTGAPTWESVLTEPGIREEQAASVVASHDGFFVHASGFVDPALKARHRLVKLDARGKVLWKWYPNNRGPIQIPQFFRGELTPQGTVRIDGYIQLEKDGPVLGWTAEVNADGKTLRDEVGAAELGHRNGMP